MDTRTQVQEFLTTRRAKLTPEQAGLPFAGGQRRVAGLRREEVAMLSGVSVHYDIRLERGNLAYGTEPDTASEQAMQLLASWAVTQHAETAAVNR